MTKRSRLWASLVAAIVLLVTLVWGMPHYGKAQQSGAAGQMGLGSAGEAAQIGKLGEAGEADGSAGSGELKNLDESVEIDKPGEAGEQAGLAVGTKGMANSAAAIEGEKKLTPVMAVTKALENERYILYIDERTGNLRIMDKTTQQQWLGSPQLESTVMPNVKKFTEVPVHIRYTEGADITQAYPLKDGDSSVAVKILADTVQVRVSFDALKLSFDLEYRLTDNGFEVSIPQGSIQEQGAARLTSIEPLPFFHAATEQDKGAILLPDGSGALLEFREVHPAYLRGYSEYIYGSDPTFIKQNHDIVESQWVHALAPKQSITLPVFGIYRNDSGFLAIVTQGEMDAKINGVPAGVRAINLYRASTEFMIRKDDIIFVGNSGQIPYYQGQQIEGDRSVRYVLLEGEDAGYVGMAKAYRNYLLQEEVIKPISQETQPLQVHVLGGILRDEIIGSTFIKMTTFEQVKQMIDAYASQGVTDLELTLDGWSKNGLYGNQPAHFPVERHLGGAKGLRDLERYAGERGVTIYLKANYVRAYSDSGGMNKNKDAVRSINQEILKHANYYISNPWNNDDEMFYLMKPQRVFDRHISKEAGKFAELGIGGVQFKYFGDMLYSDEDKKSAIDRKSTAKMYLSALDLFREQVGRTAVDYGFGYTFGHVDRIDHAPLDSSHFVYTDRTVPFYQLVVHGLIPYVSSPVNLYDDSRNQLLRAVEYGALPSYELTAEPTSKLQRTMGDRLFSSALAHWLESSASLHLELKQVYGAIMNEQMVNHEELQRGVYRTTYANGTQTIVNYNSHDVTVAGQTVKKQSYLLLGG